MHPSVMTFVAAVVRGRGLNHPSKRVLEVGAYNVNGSVRPLFDQTAYVGVDIRPGPGVDLVVRAGEPYWLGAGPLRVRTALDVVVSTEMLEHDPRPWVTVPNMGDVLAPGGVLILTTRGFGFGEHEHPCDYWRFSPASIGLLLRDANLVVDYIDVDPDPESPGVFAVAIRP